MAYVTDPKAAKEIIAQAVAKGVSLAIFCTGSFWNTEAILRAASAFAEKRGIKNIPIVIAMTVNYSHMQQARRFTRCGDPRIGFIAAFRYCKLLCEGPGAPYANVTVLPHLDHADPAYDEWALTEGTKYLASAMFDCQMYSYEDNVRKTAEYVEKYGKEVLVEGIFESLSVGNEQQAQQADDYVAKALEFVKRTGVDFLVADLGTEQQSENVGGVYLRDRARGLTKALGKPMLVLHGASSLERDVFDGFSEDGIVRVNMWTRIVREAGQYAAEQLQARYDDIKQNNFEATESRQYLYDSTDAATEIMEQILERLAYGRLGG